MADEVVVAKTNKVTKSQLHNALSEIADGMRQVVNSTIKVARTIAKYQNTAIWSDVEDYLINEGQWFDPTVLSMYKRIGNHPAIQNKANIDKLPPSYNTLYHLSFADPERLEKAIAKGAINVKTTLTEAKEFSEKDKKTSSKKTGEAKTELFSVTVKIRFSDGKGKKGITKEALNALKIKLARYEATVTWIEF